MGCWAKALEARTKAQAICLDNSLDEGVGESFCLSEGLGNVLGEGLCEGLAFGSGFRLGFGLWLWACPRVSLWTGVRPWLCVPVPGPGSGPKFCVDLAACL